MKTFFTVFAICISSMTQLAYAQCDHDPTIQSELIDEFGTLMMCPPSDSTTEVSTIEGDSHQWYFREMSSGSPWQAIEDATFASLTIDYYTYSARYLMVEVTIDGCTEQSPELLVDGWVFLLPYMIIEFENDQYQIIDDYLVHICPGNTVTFSAGQPYVNDIQWFMNDEAIPNQTNLSFTAEQTGDYRYDACTVTCPDYCASNTGNPIQNYSLVFGDWAFCNMSTNDPQSLSHKGIYPNPAIEMISLQGVQSTLVNIEIYDAKGALTQQIIDHNVSKPIQISHLPKGIYYMLVQDDIKQLKFKFIKK